jgi:putative hydrolase of the HAD superfamily
VPAVEQGAGIQQLRYRAVLFDLFGTLTPCYPLDGVQLAIREMAADLALPVEAFEAVWSATFESRQTAFYASVEENLSAVLEMLGEERSDLRIATAAERRLRFEAVTVRPRQGVLEALGRLRLAEVRVGVISNCSIETPLAWPGQPLQGAVDLAIFSCHAQCAKPDRQIYLQAARSLDVSPSDCLFVGDGSSDELAGARSCGIDAVLIRGPDDDDTFPGRISRANWDGPTISSISEVCALVSGNGFAPVRRAPCGSG